MQPRGVLDIPDAAVVLIAQTTRTPLSLGDVLPVLGVSLITSEGARTACRGSAIAIPVGTLNVVPSIPAVGLVLALSVDRFIGMARAPGNLIGNCVATLVVAAWQGDLGCPMANRCCARISTSPRKRREVTANANPAYLISFKYGGNGLALLLSCGLRSSASISSHRAFSSESVTWCNSILSSRMASDNSRAVSGLALSIRKSRHSSSVASSDSSRSSILATGMFPIPELARQIRGVPVFLFICLSTKVRRRVVGRMNIQQ